MKSKNIAITVIIIILVVVFAPKKDVLVDHMLMYDDFETGIDLSKWTTVEEDHSTGNAESDPFDRYEYDMSGQPYDHDFIHIYDDGSQNSLNPEGGGQYGNTNYRYWSTVTSRRQWTTENIKFKYRQCYDSCDYRHGSISYNGQAIQMDANLLHFTQNPQCYYYGGEGVVEILRYDDLDLSKYVVVHNGEEVYTGVQDGPATLDFIGGGSSSEYCQRPGLLIDYVKYEPYYSCEIDYQVEVVVRDTFYEGSTVSLSTLTYTPTKFCPQDLGVLIFSDQGFTDELGSISEAIASGEQLIVPDGKYWQVDYVTQYVDDMEERCGVGEAYDTETQTCVSVAHQEIPDEGLLFCQQTQDCAIPPQCYDAEVSCINNRCEYVSDLCTEQQIINYLLVMQTIDLDEPYILVLNNGEVQVTFNTPQDIAGMDFQDQAPTPLVTRPQCQVANGEYLSPIDGCYRNHIYWDGYSFDVENGETIDLDDHITVKYIMSGTGVFNGERYGNYYDYEYLGRDSDYTNTYQVTLKNILDIDLIGYDSVVDLNDQHGVSIEVTNNLFDMTESGYKLRVNREILDISEPLQSFRMPLMEGSNTYTFDLPTDQIGVYTIELIPFFDVLGSTQYMVQQLVISYYVSAGPQDCIQLGCPVGVCQGDGTCLVGQVVDCTTVGCPTGYLCDSGSGACTQTIQQDCNQLGCGSGYTCNTNTGACETTRYINTGDSGSFDFESIMPVVLVILGFIVVTSALKK